VKGGDVGGGKGYSSFFQRKGGKSLFPEKSTGKAPRRKRSSQKMERGEEGEEEKTLFFCQKKKKGKE